MRPRSVAAYAWPLALLALLALVDSYGLTNDPDAFWHLRVGRSVLETHSALPRDIFSYSYEGRPWRYKDLVADVVLYAGFAVLGYRWLLALKVAAVAVMAFACHAIVRPRDRQPLVLLLCAGLVIDSFWPVERPNLFSMALFAVVLAQIERARRASREESARGIACVLVPIVAVNVVWSSLHTFALLGHLLLLGLAGTLFAARLAPDTPFARALLGTRPSRTFVLGSVLAAVASPILGLANPSGVNIWRGVFAVAGSPEIRAVILEWRRLGPIELARAFPVATFTFALAFAVLLARVVRAVRAREEDAPVSAGHVATLFAVGAMAASSVRWLPFAAIAAPLYLAMVLGDALTRRAVRVPRGAAILLGVVLLVLLRARQGDAPIAIGEDPEWSPRGAVRFASEHGLRGRVANSMELGGYLLFASWPDARVLVDGRGVYDTDFVVRCIFAEHDAPTFFAMRADDATWALAVNRPDQVAYGFLARDPRWAMIYWSDTAAVYVRRGAHPELEPLAYRFVDPYDVPGSIAQAILRTGGAPEKLDAVLAEVRRMLDASPDSVRANLGFAAFLAALGPAHRADLDALLARLVLLTRDSPEMRAFARSLAPSPAP